MSITSGYNKYKRYEKLSDGTYKLVSLYTSSNTVHFDDGETAQTKVGAISGITDSLTATSSNVALSAKAGNSLQTQINDVNSNLEIVSALQANQYTSIVSMCYAVMADRTMSFKISDYRLVTDYPSTLIDNGAVLYPIVTINKYETASYVTVTAVRADGIPYSIHGYMNNNTVYWNTELY